MQDVVHPFVTNYHYRFDPFEPYDLLELNLELSVANESQNAKPSRSKKPTPAPKKAKTSARVTEAIEESAAAVAEAKTPEVVAAPVVAAAPAGPGIIIDAPKKVLITPAPAHARPIVPAAPATVAVQQKIIVDNGDDELDGNTFEPEDPNAGKLSLQISRALYFRMKHQAREEGLSLEEYAVELLAEGVVLRAWEIIEKKGQMRGVAASPGNSNAPRQQQGQGNSGNNARGHSQQQSQGSNNNNNRKGPGRMSQNRYQSIMDDKANFLEYVRSQERNRR